MRTFRPVLYKVRCLIRVTPLRQENRLAGHRERDSAGKDLWLPACLACLLVFDMKTDRA